MSESESTDTPPQEKTGILTRLVKLLLVAVLVAPAAAIQAYLLTPETVEEIDEIEARVTYVAGKQQQHEDEVEVDLGHFDVSIVRPEINKVLRVRFQLAALVPDRFVGRYEDFMKEQHHRFRDRIIMELQRTETILLTDPRLVELRSNLILVLNEMATTPTFRNVIFSNYSVRQQ